jgi:hypothetical protein
VIAVDTNVLVHAQRPGRPEHAPALAWLQHLATGPIPWGLPVFCLGEFLRVVTHPRLFDPPTPVADALAALEGLIASPSVRVLLPGSGFPRLLAECVRRGDARGNLVFDAQIAALCLEHGATDLLTCDRDFARFPGLRLRTLDEPPLR